MAKAANRATRIAADLMDSAAIEGARVGRSAKQQLEHWARVGREVSSQEAAAVRRVESALAGDLDLHELNPQEGAVFNVEVAAAVQERLTGSNYGALLAERSVTTVAIDQNGEIIEHRPDGSSVPLSAKMQPRDA
jgi:ParD-like antitoxin of type II bacterial toxin-antitoxin system